MKPEMQKPVLMAMLQGPGDTGNQFSYDCVVSIAWRLPCCGHAGIVSIDRPAYEDAANLTEHELQTALTYCRDQATKLLREHVCGSGPVFGAEDVQIPTKPPSRNH